ncbi:hypothetical protein SUNI508_10716 [Seiridium unicorne]|uniref:RING-type domain-containing protein n=1 Tax=Seiridium unicorne TaxID=138068 RepID=A0ABR2UK76_9PEZI
MAIFNQAFVDGAHAVARAVARQASDTASSVVSSTITSAINSATGSATSTALPSITSPASSSLPSSITSTAPDPASSTNSGGGNNGSTGTSSPLLFFVALGFGVVFTNLWIIVGVKYCFRYNARNRQMRGLDENGDPINLENMPTRPHRRRREKKLMTMDEVNDKFPMMKYKTWVADRAKEGLPTTGGVSAPPSRANSVRSVEGIVPEVPAKERESSEVITAAGDKSNTGNVDGATNNTADNDIPLTQTQTAGSIMTKDPDRGHASDDEDDDDHINAAVPPELLATSGDTCAICIDTLEDDDDVRGLTCGHAFHAVCLDPWLTNRRACCPLCKADYYTPKPRPPPADGDANNAAASNPADPSRNNGRLNMPRQPQRSLTGWTLRDGPRSILGRYGNSTNIDSHGRPRRSDRDRRRPANSRGTSRTTSRTNSRAARTTTAAAPSQDPEQQASWLTRVRNRLPTFRQNAGTTGPTASSANNAEPTTPSQLEAGTRASS